MLLKFSTVFALAATLASVHQSEAATQPNYKIDFPGPLTIFPVYQTLSPFDTFAEACASNTFQLRLTTIAFSDKQSTVDCNIDLTKLNDEQYCALTNPKEFYGLECGTAVVKVLEDAVTGIKKVYTTVEADFTGSNSPPKVTACSKVRLEGGSKKLVKRWNAVKTVDLDPFVCPYE